MFSDNVLEVQAIYRGLAIDTRVVDARAKRRQRAPRATYVVGATKGVHAPLDPAYAGGPELALAEVGPTDVLVNVTATMTGEVTDGGAAIPLDRWTAEHGNPFVLPETARAHVVCGDVAFVLTHVPRAPFVARPWLTLSWREQKYTVGAGIALLLSLAMLSLVPPDAHALSFDRYDARLRFTQFLITPVESKPPAADGRTPSDGPKSASGARHAGPEGKMGKPTSAQTNQRFALQGPRDNADPHLARNLADQVKTYGILGVLRGLQGSPIASVFGRDTALGTDDTTVLGNLIAPTTGEAPGIGGLGLVGTGAGAAGTGEGTIGLGRLGTIGGLPGGGRDPGYGRGGPGRLPGRRTMAPSFIPGEPSVRGSLDKEIIRRIIRRHINEVKYCYEKELMHDQTLSGRIAVNFTIAPTGAVAAAVVQSSTMTGGRVPACVVDAVRRWEFPRPAGGGLVIATYPFTFMAAGER